MSGRLALVGAALAMLALPAAAAAQSVRVGVASSDIAPVTPAVITVSRAGDGLGAPIALLPRIKPRASGAAITADMPRGFPLSGAITSRFGMRAHPLLGGYRMHSGVDVAAPSGTPILAPADGIVSYANWRGGYGLSVSVDHGGGVQTRFGHMSRLAVYPGERVVRGQILGLVGSTGRSTGPHLHYEMRYNGQAIDPLAHAH